MDGYHLSTTVSTKNNTTTTELSSLFTDTTTVIITHSNNIAPMLAFNKSSVSFIFVFFVLGALIFFGNAMVCYAYYKVKKLRTLTNKLVMSTSVSGMLIGILFVPFFVVLDDVLSIHVMPVSSFLASFLGFSMLFNIAALTYERYIAVFRSLEYNSVITNYRVNRALIVVWLIPLFLSTIPNVFPLIVADQTSLYILFKVYQGFLSCVLSLIFIVFFVTYFRVWRTSLFHIAFDRKQRLSVASTKLAQQIQDFNQRRSSISLHCCCLSSQPPHKSTGYQSENEENNTEASEKDVLVESQNREESDSVSGGSGDSSIEKRRLSSCSITLNGVLFSDDDSHVTESHIVHQHPPPPRRRSKISNPTTSVVRSPRKLSVEWQPRNVERLAVASKRVRKYSAPVYSGVTVVGGEKRRRNRKRFGSLPSFDMDDLVFELKQIEWRDKTKRARLPSAVQQRNQASNSASSCSPELSPETRLRRSRVSFASTESDNVRCTNSSFYKKQIRGIIKNTEDRTNARRLNNAPRKWRTVAYEPKDSPNVFKKSYSMPANLIAEKIIKNRQAYIKKAGLKSGKSWPNPLTPPVNLNRKATKRTIKRTYTLVETPSEHSSLASTPGECTPVSTPGCTPRHRLSENSLDTATVTPTCFFSPTYSPLLRKKSPSPLSRKNPPSPLSRKKSPSPLSRKKSPSPLSCKKSPSPLSRKKSPSPNSILKSPFSSPRQKHGGFSLTTTSLESVRCTPVRCVSPSDMSTVTEEIDCDKSPNMTDSNRIRKKPLPASVRRALFRIRSLESTGSKTSRNSVSLTATFDRDDASRFSPLLRDGTNDMFSDDYRRPSIASSVASRFMKSRNSVISQAREFLHEIKHTRVIAVIVLINALCWLPLIFINFADATGNRDLVTPTLNLVSDFSFLLNSLLMPYIYAFCKHDFKTVFRKKCNCIALRKKRR